MIRVLIVDDSSFMRRSLGTMLKNDPEFELVGSASDGQEAIELVKKLKPDVVTLDVEMPKVDGLTALKKIMEENPLPVIMLSSLTTEGATTTLKALEEGAMDFMGKQTSSSLADAKNFERELKDKLKAVAKRKSLYMLSRRRKALANFSPDKVKPRKAINIEPAAPRHVIKEPIPVIKPGRYPYDIVVIGVSTGGPPAVQKILSALPENFPTPIVIAQHMPASFTGAFAARLDRLSKISVKEADEVERLRPGTAYVCPGGRHIKIENRGGVITGVVTDEPKSALYKPSANVLMETAGQVLGRRTLGVMLTGMGSDGVLGAKILKESGGKMIAQNEESCVVYGMPKAVVDGGLADEIIDLENMTAAIVRQFV